MRESLDQAIPDLLTALHSHRAAVLSAPPGAGKTTRVPQALLEAGLCPGQQIVMLQPRRMAARAVAAWMARQRGEPLGQTVGYKIRFDTRASQKTRILVMTEGVLTRRFLTDPFLDGVGCVILDEFHERSIHLDLALAFCRELLSVRHDFRLLVMSATLDVQPLSAYLGACPVVQVESPPYPLAIEHLDAPDDRPLPLRVASAVRRALESGPGGGDVLVFLPGAGEIHRTQSLLAAMPLPASTEILLLYGALPAEQQDRALLPGDRRRVILATNIAETSLTVPGVRTVVDCGLCKQLRQDPRTGLDRLDTVRISQQSATQRAGRAARSAPGRVYRLWTQAVQGELPVANLPEIRRVDLAPTLLSLLLFQPGDPRTFPFFEAPDDPSVEASVSLLRMLDLVEGEGFQLTPRGKRLAPLPLHPRLACILETAAQQGLASAGALLVALLSERDLERRDFDHQAGQVEFSDSDLLARADRFASLTRRGFTREAARALGLHFSAAQAVRQSRQQLLRMITPHAHEEADRAVAGSSGLDDNAAALCSCLLSGYPDRVCRRRDKDSSEARMVGGRGVRLSERSGVTRAPLFLALQARERKRGAHSSALVDVASAIDAAMLAERFPHLGREEEGAVFDPESRSVKGVRRRWFADLLLEEKTGLRARPEHVAEALARQARTCFADLFKPDEKARQILARVHLARAHLAEVDWPDVSQEGLQSWLDDLCQGKSRLAELESLDWAHEIQKRLGERSRRLLDQHLPERLPVPSGSQIRIDYTPALEDQPPVLAVRIQEVFGLVETPRLARGRVPMLLHLLSPSLRPVQVTADLRSFWTGTYAQVRKELRARYPKHAWPDDPLSAPPQRGAKRRS